MTSFIQRSWDGQTVERPLGASDRQWSIFNRHINLGESLKELATSYGITTTRVRQVIWGVNHRVIHQAGQRPVCPCCGRPLDRMDGRMVGNDEDDE